MNFDIGDFMSVTIRAIMSLVTLFLVTKMSWCLLSKNTTVTFLSSRVCAHIDLTNISAKMRVQHFQGR